VDVDLSGVEWLKSSFSAPDAENPVEVAFLPDGYVAIRDLKNTEIEAHIFTPLEWECFVKGVLAGEFDPEDDAPENAAPEGSG
jgi:hypothetical protein